METGGIELLSSNIGLFATSTPPQENNNSGLDSELLNNNNPGLSQSNELLFIDSAIENYQTLIDNLVEQTEVIILDSRRDGIVQITNSPGCLTEVPQSIEISCYERKGGVFMGS